MQTQQYSNTVYYRIYPVEPNTDCSPLEEIFRLKTQQYGIISQKKMLYGCHLSTNSDIYL